MVPTPDPLIFVIVAILFTSYKTPQCPLLVWNAVAVMKVPFLFSTSRRVRETTTLSSWDGRRTI